MNHRHFSNYRLVLFLAVALALFTGAAVRQSFGTTVPHYLITGTVVDPSNAPIAQVGVSASATINGTNHLTPTVNTDASGHYSLSVSSGGLWTVAVNSYGNNSLDSAGYNPADPEYITISNQNAVVNFIAPNYGEVELSGYLTDTNNNPIAGVGVTASLPSDTNYPNFYAVTDANGFYELMVVDGYWNVSLNCSNLTALGFQCVDDQTNIGIGSQNVRLPTVMAQTNGMVVITNFFGGEVLLGDSWYYLAAPAGNQQAFGTYNKANFPYLFREDMGWEYFIDANDAAHGAFFYDFADSVFFYTTPALWPYLYDFKSNAWMFYAPRGADTYSSNPRWFLNMSTGVWGNHLN